MDELIWFSIPGAVISFAVIMVFPEVINTDSKFVAIVFLSPLIGFVIHQSYRLVFELTGGFARKSRTVIDRILKELATEENIALKNRESAFMVWEITFYSEGFPSPFMNHDRGAWHYILSFWSITFAAVLSMLFCILAYFTFAPVPNSAIAAILELVIGLIFYYKGLTSYRSLCAQEVAITHTHKELFVKTLKKINA